MALMTKRCVQRPHLRPCVYLQQHRHRWTPLDVQNSLRARHHKTLLNQALYLDWIKQFQLCIDKIDTHHTHTQEKKQVITSFIEIFP